MKWTEIQVTYRSRLDAIASADPYELLGVDRDVSEKDLRQAYMARVKAYHPDRADPFMKAYHEEVLKLVNAAHDGIRRKSGYAD